MRLEHYPVEKLKSQLLAIIAKYLDLADYRVFFFGSRVAGQGSERSDIDVGIEGPEEIPFGTMAKIREEMEELPTLYKIEAVDFNKVSNQFREVARQFTENL